MSLIEWVRYPKRTFQRMQFASMSAVCTYLQTFMQVWDDGFGGQYRLRYMVSDVTQFCLWLIGRGSVPESVFQTCVHTLCVIGTAETALALQTTTPRAKELVDAYIMGNKPHVGLYPTDLDEHYLLQAALRVKTLQKDMDSYSYWLQFGRIARDEHWLEKTFALWKYDLDDPLFLEIESVAYHITYLQNQKLAFRTGDCVYLRLPMPLYRLEAGKIGTIVFFDYDIATVRWATTMGSFAINPMLLSKIG